MAIVSQLLFEAELRRLIESHDGLETVRRFVQDDPLQRFAHWFNDCMGEIREEFIVRAYQQPQAVMARKVALGLIPDVPQFLSMFSSVLLMTALHYRTLSYHKEHPRVRVKKSPDMSATQEESWPLFLALNHTDRFVSRETDPAETAGQRDDLRAAMLRARQLGRLPLAIYRRVREFAFVNGTDYGAYRQVARMTDLDSQGQVIRVRRRAQSQTNDPPAAIVRQVRRLYQEAVLAIKTIGFEGE